MRGEAIQHQEQRHGTLRCTCGYEAEDARDLQEHLDAMRDDTT